MIGCLLGMGLAIRGGCLRRLEVTAGALFSETVRVEALGRRRLLAELGPLSGSAGEVVTDFLFLLRVVVGSFDEARACSKACHAMSSSALSTCGSGEALIRRFRGVDSPPGLLSSAGSVSLKRLPAP